MAAADATTSNGHRSSLLPALPEGVPSAVRTAVDAVVSRAMGGTGPLRAAVEVAEDHRTGAATVEEAIDRLVATHVRLAGVSGFVTGLGGVVTLPLSLGVGVGGLYLLAARMVVGIAHLRGYDVKSEEVKSAVAVCLLGSAGSEAVKRAGVRLGGRLVARAGTRVGRAVPLLGAPIGGAVDVAACWAIARYARRVFVPVVRP